MSNRQLDARGTVEQTLESMAGAVSAGDFERWRSLWHPDAQQFAPNTPAAVGLANILFGARGWFEEWTHDMTICCDEVRVVGAWAFASGSLTLRSVSRREGKADILAGRFLAVLTGPAEDGWRIYRYCYNSSVPLAHEG